MKLSIITINKNNAGGLEKTIQSVVCQKFTDYEYIVIDGNSTDNSVEIIKKYADYIHYWLSEPDTGIYNAMNKGIKKAIGEYVIFMNSADCFVSENTLMNVFSKKHTAELLVGNLIRVWKRSQERGSFPAKMNYYNFIAGPGIMPHQATFFKRNLFEEIGLYDEQFKIGADRKFFLLALFKYDKSFEKMDEDIALMDTTGISHTEANMLCCKQEVEEMFKQLFPYFYEDYKELYRLKRFTFHRLKRHIKWRLRKFLRG